MLANKRPLISDIRPKRMDTQRKGEPLMRTRRTLARVAPVFRSAETRTHFVLHLGRRYHSEDVPVMFESRLRVKEKTLVQTGVKTSARTQTTVSAGVVERFSFSFALSGAIVLMLLLGAGFVSRGIFLKGEVLGVSSDGYEAASRATMSFAAQDFSGAQRQFQEAYGSFDEASQKIEGWAGVLSDVSLGIPVLSQLSSAKYALAAGGHLSAAGGYMSAVSEKISVLGSEDSSGSNLLSFFGDGGDITNAARELEAAGDDLSRVHIRDIPEDKRDTFLLLKNALPGIVSYAKMFSENSRALTEALGGNGPRKYLFLFQNNHEARATGGFIGSYGLLDIRDGRIREFFVDGIFNPDGQLSVDIVPPMPIQKVSVGWSLHDSNWFADFPTSAKKASFFYEKTGGPTTDGVIAVTPTVMEEILRITGPVGMPEYGAVVTAENFVETIQYEVEVDYDKEENRPKKILGDLVPKILEKLLSGGADKNGVKMLSLLWDMLGQGHILLYSRSEDIERMYSELGWSGELREAPMDFVSVVNSNINGFKTDGVIDQTISHEANIRADGTIEDTVTITRTHTGGATPYAWWNAVNADYMRVYVPKGARLLSALGQTRETVKPPLDYSALGFSFDDDVERIENTIAVDPDSGTQIFEESGKTVFGNWVYVSPRESVTVRYTYLLPWQISPDEVARAAETYSLLAQKQSGAVHPSDFSAKVTFPDDWAVQAHTAQEIEEGTGEIQFSAKLETDEFFGAVFTK